MALKDNKVKFKPVKIKKNSEIDIDNLERVNFKVKKTDRRDYFLQVTPKSSKLVEDTGLQIHEQPKVEPIQDNKMEGSITTIVERKQEFETPHKNEWIFETENTVSKVILIEAIELKPKAVPSINKMFYLNKATPNQEEMVQKEVISTEDSNETTLEEYVSDTELEAIPVVTAEEPIVNEKDPGIFAIAPLSLKEMQADNYATSETFLLNNNNLDKDEQILEEFEQEEAPLVVQDEDEILNDETKTSAFGEQTTEDALNEAQIEPDNLDEEIEKIQQELNAQKTNEVNSDDYLAGALIGKTAQNTNNNSEPTAEEILFDTFVEGEIKRQNKEIEEDNFYEEIINSLLE